MIRILLAALLLLGAAPALAQEQGPAGRWALRVEGRTLLILELSRTRDRVGFWRGGFRQPRTMRWSGRPGSGTFSFTGVEGPVIERPMRLAMPRNDGVHIAFAAPLPGQPDMFLFTLAADGSGALDMPGSGLPPLRLVRVGPGEAVPESWDPARTYIAERRWPTNAEMTGARAAFPIIAEKEPRLGRSRIKSYIDPTKMRPAGYRPARRSFRR